MSVQVKRRRDTAANIAGFTPAQGELVVDVTNNRVIVGDGVTAGGFPAAKLSEVVTPAMLGAGVLAAVETTPNSAGGLAVLNGSGQLPASTLPASIAGSLNYQGVWNASANTPALASSTGSKGFYYKVGVAGSTAIDGNSQWNVGDIIAFDGTSWDKIDGSSNEVLSVVGQTGAVAAAQISAAINTRTPISDAAYSALATDRSIAYVALTASRVVSLPAASAFPGGALLIVMDETGAASATKTITLAANGSDLIDGASSALISSAYGFLSVQSNGAASPNGKWTIIHQSNSNIGPVGIGTAADPTNPLSVYGSSALFNGASFSFTINKSAAANTASILFQDGFSGRAQMGLNGSDNYSFKTSANGSTWATALQFDAGTGAATFANMRTAVSDAAYGVLTTDRMVAYAALTAARVVSLPLAASFPPGHLLTIIDESGACSATNTLIVNRSGTDTIAGQTSAVLQTPGARIVLESNGSNRWSVISRSANIINFAASGTYYPSAGVVAVEVYLVGAGGGGGGGALQAASAACSGGAGGGSGAANHGLFPASAIGASQAVTIGSAGAAGAAATTSTTAGGAGGNGGATSFGTFLLATGGGGGAGGQLAANSGGGGGGGLLGAATAGSGAAAGGAATFGGNGGSGVVGSLGSFPFGGSGGAGGANGGTGPSGQSATMGGSSGGAGGGISAANAVFAGGSGGYALSSSSYGHASGGAAGAAGAAGADTSPSINFLGAQGGGGGGSSLTAAGAGGAGATGGGGGGGGSAQNGGAAAAGGVGGAGYAIIVERFN